MNYTKFSLGIFYLQANTLKNRIFSIDFLIFLFSGMVSAFILYFFNKKFNFKRRMKDIFKSKIVYGFVIFIVTIFVLENVRVFISEKVIASTISKGGIMGILIYLFTEE
ncbi:hypothetical protein [Clostridium ganghwense]|uniref:Uncharacterized protein n=1 Tax=Clostridium ganghwense TaxID=312089 RepID=A0ABT4CVC4_9CLOT|nr:hypothetical protein [Clostridium ganghwense]MCY6372161.1 hypothetical protein [Clostridium ganghwense]